MGQTTPLGQLSAASSAKLAPINDYTVEKISNGFLVYPQGYGMNVNKTFCQNLGEVAVELERKYSAE